MGLNIKNPEVETLVKEMAALLGVNKTEAIRRALEEKKHLLSLEVIKSDRRVRLKNLLEQKIWPRIPKGQLGKRLTREEKDQILGFG